MVTGLDIITHNRPLQEHWFKRFFAVVIDFIIVSIPTWYGFWLWNPLIQDQWLLTSISSSGAFMFLYSALLENAIGSTIGKLIFKLKVESLSGNLTLVQTLERNISKVIAVFLFLDWPLGLATEGDPRQRYLDRIANTTVIHSDTAPEYGASAHYRDFQPKTAPKKETSKTTTKRCRKCRGPLIYIDENRCKCKKCGLIQ